MSSSGRTTRELRVAIVEDHLLQRSHTVSLLTAHAGLRVVFSGETLPNFIAWLVGAPASDRPQLLILDLMVDRGPNADPAVVERLVAHGVHVLLFSAMASPSLVRKMMRAGVSGIIGKRDTEADIIAAVRAVSNGESWTTPELAAVIASDSDRPRLSGQEERALVLYASGLTMKGVAAALGVKRETAKSYIERVKSKYAAAGWPLRSKIDLNRAALADGLLDNEPDRGSPGAAT